MSLMSSDNSTAVDDMYSPEEGEATLEYRMVSVRPEFWKMRTVSTVYFTNLRCFISIAVWNNNEDNHLTQKKNRRKVKPETFEEGIEKKMTREAKKSFVALNWREVRQMENY